MINTLDILLSLVAVAIIVCVVTLGIHKRLNEIELKITRQHSETLGVMAYQLEGDAEFLNSLRKSKENRRD